MSEDSLAGIVGGKILKRKITGSNSFINKVKSKKDELKPRNGCFFIVPLNLSLYYRYNNKANLFNYQYFAFQSKRVSRFKNTHEFFKLTLKYL